jgi:hypothetical protein
MGLQDVLHLQPGSKNNNIETFKRIEGIGVLVV